MRTRRGDLAMLGYLAVCIFYVFSAMAQAVSALFHLGLQVRSAFVWSLAAYFGATALAASWIYRDVLRRRAGRDAFGWLIPFIFLGGIALPLYYFRSERGNGAPLTRNGLLIWIARALAALLIVTGSLRFGFAIGAALWQEAFSADVSTLGIADKVLVYVAWIVTLILLIQKPWATAKKIGWAIGALLGSFILLQIVVFAELEA